MEKIIQDSGLGKERLKLSMLLTLECTFIYTRILYTIKLLFTNDLYNIYKRGDGRGDVIQRIGTSKASVQQAEMISRFQQSKHATNNINSSIMKQKG